VVWLPDGEHSLMMYNRFDRIQECDGQTDGRTDILRRHSPRYAQHRAVIKSNMVTISGFRGHMTTDQWIVMLTWSDSLSVQRGSSHCRGFKSAVRTPLHQSQRRGVTVHVLSRNRSTEMQRSSSDVPIY